MFSIPFQAEGAVAAGLPEHFVQDNHSVSYAVGTIRGLHLQLPPHEQGKLVRVLRGRILDVIVDLRPGSPTVGRSDQVELDTSLGRLLWVPPGFAHGFCTLEPDTEVFYKVDSPYRPDAELSVAWDDPTLNINWPVEANDVVLSEKDKNGVSLTEALAAIRSALDAATAGPNDGENRREPSVTSPAASTTMAVTGANDS